jgi:hypothetical protein
MRNLLVVLGAACAPLFVHADAGTSVSIERAPTVLTFADGTQQVLAGDSATLRPGDTIAYSFEYALAAFDGGLPVTEVGAGPSWGSITLTLMSTWGVHREIPMSGLEIAAVSVYFHAQPAPPWFDMRLTDAHLATTPDEAPESLALSGSGRAAVTLLPGWGVDEVLVTLPAMVVDEVALFDRVEVAGRTFSAAAVSPVPEPGSLVQLLAGLGVLVGLRRHLHAMVPVRS